MTIVCIGDGQDTAPLPTGSRTRRRLGPGAWRVRARVERFGEPALLLLLREATAPGSEWDEDAAGPANRIYELTDDGRALLDEWAEALRGAAETIDAFLARYAAKGGDHVPR